MVYQLKPRNEKNEEISIEEYEYEKQFRKTPADLIPEDEFESLLCLSLVPSTGLNFDELFYKSDWVHVRKLAAIKRAADYTPPSKPS